MSSGYCSDGVYHIILWLPFFKHDNCLIAHIVPLFIGTRVPSYTPGTQYNVIRAMSNYNVISLIVTSTIYVKFGLLNV